MTNKFARTENVVLQNEIIYLNYSNTKPKETPTEQATQSSIRASHGQQPTCSVCIQ